MHTTRFGIVCLIAAAAAGSAFGQAPAAYLEVSKARVKPERLKEWEDGVKKLIDIQRRLKGDHWLTLSTEFGDSGSFLISTARENFAASQTGMDAFMKALKEGMGTLGEKLMYDLTAASVSFKSEMRRRRYDLSVNPPADAAAMTNLVGHARWIRTVRLDVKPGRAPEYIEAWKQFQAELQQVSPPITALVSESITGTPALTVGMYYKSMAQIDEQNSAVQKAVSTPAYQNLMKVSSEALAMTNWEIHRVRPELSNPTDEIVATDPSFWKPPVMTTSTNKKSTSADRNK